MTMMRRRVVLGSGFEEDSPGGTLLLRLDDEIQRLPLRHQNVRLSGNLPQPSTRQQHSGTLSASSSLPPPRTCDR